MIIREDMPVSGREYDSLFYTCPVVLVTSRHKGIDNILTIAWTGIACSHPELIYVSIRKTRFSYDLICNSREFGVNIPSMEYLREVDICGTISGREQDKFSVTGFERFYGECTEAPLIRQCKVNLECKVIRTLELGSHDMIIGEVMSKHINMDLKKVDIAAMDPVLYNKPYYYSINMERKESYGFTSKKKNSEDTGN